MSSFLQETVALQPPLPILPPLHIMLISLPAVDEDEEQVPEKKRRLQSRSDLHQEILLVAEDAADEDFIPPALKGAKQNRGGARRVKGQTRKPLADENAAAPAARTVWFTSPSILMVSQLIMACLAISALLSQ